MIRKWVVVAGVVCLGHVAGAQPAKELTRGELLYSTHCIACHSVQLHWRDKKQVTDWNSLRVEVRRWQERAGLGWNDDDVAEVARYLNALHYRYPLPDVGRPLAGDGAKRKPY